jgi:hypothetical protein
MPDNLTAPVHKFLSEGMGIDEVIGELKRIGFDRALTVRALRQVTGMAAAEAEARVSRHRVWTVKGEPKVSGPCGGGQT